jgi:hypothetical protein
MTTTVDYHDFNVANVHASSTHVFGKIYILHANTPLILNSPLLRVPFGLSEFTNYGKTTYTLNLSFQDDNDDVNIMKDRMHSLDVVLMELAVKNSMEWFKKNLSREEVAKMYKPICKPSNNPSYASTFRVKVKQHANGTVLTDVVNKISSSKCDINDIQKGCLAEVHVSFSPVWIVNNTFGISLLAEKIEITEKPSEPIKRNFNFIDEE